MNIPDEWNNILSMLHNNGFPEAIIAGGALRDLDNHRKIKDLDIFIVDRGCNTKQILDKVFNIATESFQASSDDPDSDTLDPLAKIYEYSGNLHPMQFIVMPNGPHTARRFLDQQLERFDIGLCRIGYDGKNVVRHDAYLLDQLNMTLTILHANTLKQSRARLERIGLKYPDFKLVGL